MNDYRVRWQFNIVMTSDERESISLRISVLLQVAIENAVFFLFVFLLIDLRPSTVIDVFHCRSISLRNSIFNFNW